MLMFRLQYLYKDKTTTLKVKCLMTYNVSPSAMYAYSNKISYPTWLLDSGDSLHVITDSLNLTINTEFIGNELIEMELDYLLITLIQDPLLILFRATKVCFKQYTTYA